MDWSEFSREFGYDEFDAPLSQYRAWESCREMHHTVRAWVASEGMWDDFLSIEEGEW